MTTKFMDRSRWFRRALQCAALPAAAATFAGCLDRPVEPVDPRTTSEVTFRTLQNRPEKIDLLLVIDNSGSMADKQNILADAVPNLVKDLLAPPCLGPDSLPIADQPSPADKCPAGSQREFEPVLDVHIGIITSSLGGHGSAQCVPSASNEATFALDDKGHLISRKDAADPDATVDTYGGHGFLAWDPAKKLDPQGDADIGAVDTKLRDMVRGAGQTGCGFESQLESWYRFLVDPTPYGSISVGADGKAHAVGTDDALLAQRAEFLRPDSLVAILMLTDENDCSIKESGFAYQIGNLAPRARAVCKTDPDDACCAPCGHAASDCPADPTCDAGEIQSSTEDRLNLRCFDQKRRFGLDFLYPTDRYVKALTDAKVTTRDGEVVDNPLYPADPGGAKGYRTPQGGHVFLAGVVGVPWQDIARVGADGKPDLLAGLDAKKNRVGGFMDADELAAVDPALGFSRWDVILGDPANHVDPRDPLMIESRDARKGKNPITGDAIEPESSKVPDANAINGHEWNTEAPKFGGTPMGDLQYACTFPLKQADQRDCSKVDQHCDCDSDVVAEGNNPLCQDAAGNYSTVQRRAKAYPGLRELSVLKGIGKQAIVASVCPAQVEDDTKKNYGYRPAIGALVEQLKKQLVDRCLPRPLVPDSSGQVSCLVLEARKVADPKGCCDGLAARLPVSSDHQRAVELAKEGPTAEQLGWNCFCEVEQLRGEELHACQFDTSPAPMNDGETVDGWCYVDPTAFPKAGDEKLVEQCDATERRKIRFVGAGQPLDNATTIITCAGE